MAVRAISYQLSVISYQLLAISYQLLVLSYQRLSDKSHLLHPSPLNPPILGDF
ncbi:MULTISPECIES: hypothetical protein [unclassified Moorena]|uniref:Uncharacterized protein n=1 Tax=Moorena producens 3L TaxID=489825 RepID=F4XYL1_9CYAN|nr:MULTISPECIES: hypothetical protein [unclassified Moorena]EGJ30424.1 hypothetical protein LYNGBM3L_51440 [Moorena producens 3L]NES41030.1 hypothetical protein [Moorena sp. SIO2C4]